MQTTSDAQTGSAAATTVHPAIPISLRRYLYMTALVTGAAILVIEILGAKMLSPYFGTSHFVWTAQITVTLVSLAVGYYLGGKLTDRSIGLSRMYAAILAAAFYLCLSVMLCKSVAFSCLKMQLAAGSLVAAVFLFFPPLTLLAMTGPFLIRNFTQDVASVGSHVGRVSAISTIGSVLGTVLIGYVLIPFLPNSITMYLTSIVLMSLAIGYFFLVQKNKLRTKSVVLTLVTIFAGLTAGYAGIRTELRLGIAEFEELERLNSNFGQMVVIQHTNRLLRYYLNDYLTQNTYDPGQKKSTSMFTYMLEGLSHIYTPKIDRALCIGMGVGIVPMNLAQKGIAVDVIEINPSVVGLAQRHFDFDPKKVNVIVDDGRHFLNDCTNTYDTIVLDAFLGDSSPSHLMTREAFSAMHKLLRPGGTLVINSFGDLDPGKNFFTSSLERTLESVFKSVRIHTAFGGNILFAASDTPDMKPLNEFPLDQVHSYARGYTEAALKNLVSTPPQDGRVLTDDFNPVEYYDARNREKVRQGLNSYWKTRPSEE